jgi:hypothetical protein
MNNLGKSLVILGVVLFGILLSLNLIVSNDEEEVTLLGEVELLEQDGNVLSHRIEGDFMEVILSSGNMSIGENSFENILPGKKGVFNNEIKMDKEGNIIDAYIKTSDEATFVVNRNEFVVPKGGTFMMKDGEYTLSKGTKVVKFLEGGSFSGEEISIFDELIFSGLCTIDDKGYFLKNKGGNELVGNFQGVEFSSNDKNGLRIVKDSSLDLSNAEYAWIRKTDEGLFVQGKKDPIRIKIGEGNGFFEFLNDENNHEEKYLSMILKGEDSFSLSKEKVPVFNGVLSNEEYKEVLTLKHNPTGKGSLDVYNGQHIFSFTEQGEMIQKFVGTSKHNQLAVPMEIHSGLSYKVGEDFDSPKYKIIVEESGNAIFEDNSGFGNLKKIYYELPEEDFGCAGLTKLGEEMCKCASKLVNVGAFVEGGRGDTCSIARGDGGHDIMESPVEGVLMFDCIGVAIYCLNKVYPETSLADFNPDLGLVEDLKKRGWKSYVIEPGNLFGRDRTQKQISEIPKGSVAFLMDRISITGTYVEGVDIMSYTDSKGDNYYLKVGHTYVKANGDFKVINSNPSYKLNPDSEVYKKLIEYNEQHPEYEDHYGPGFYKGPVKIGNYKGYNGYLVVMAPPEGSF